MGPVRTCTRSGWVWLGFILGEHMWMGLVMVRASAMIRWSGLGPGVCGQGWSWPWLGICGQG